QFPHSPPRAVPPVGDRRWAYPVDIDSTTGCWEGVLDGTAFAPFCVQSGQFIGNAGSEDCLYLNLWIPNWSSHDPATAQLPTLVYLYGGDLTDGYTDNYPGGTLAAKTGAAYLSVNYRVNLFGFLATRELSATSGSGCSGNFGFADQQSALRWLQRNARGLGLDAARVTVSGQSSGGTSVFALLSSPASKGLFSRALSLSGSVNLTMDRPTAEAQNAHIVQELGCAGMSSPTDTVACMRNQSTRAVQALVPSTWDSLKLIWGLPPPPTGSHVLGLDGIAIVDGCIVTKPFLEAVAEPIIDVPFVLGSLEQEPDAQPDDLVGNLTAAQWDNMVKTAFQPFGAHAAEDVLGMYAPQAAVSPALAYTSIVADYGAFCANAAAAAAAARGFTSPVYHYVISAWPSAPVWNFDTRAPNRYAFHSFDILSAFDNYGIFSAALHLPLYKPTADDLALGHTIRQ
ncbi:Ces2e, partial [Symbiodinium sp. KB8]